MKTSALKADTVGRSAIQSELCGKLGDGVKKAA
jgi:hypothetical protein